MEMSKDLCTEKQPGITAKSNKFACNLCDKVYKDHSGLRKHKHIHAKTFQCAVCDTSFPNRRRLLYHIHTRHKHKSKDFTCDICQKVFKSLKNLKIHQDVHTGLRPFKCETCGNFFKRKHHLNDHMLTHLKNKGPVTCKICQKVFSNISNLNRHKKMHRNKDYVCGDCGKIFKEESHFNYHKKIHSKKHYVCGDCGKIFNLRRNFDLHRNVDSMTDKSFVCNDCRKEFVSIRCLNHHIRHVHQERPFKCQECGLSFNDRSRRDRHSSTVHVNLRPFQCTKCDKRFKRRDNLRKHMSTHGISNDLGCCKTVGIGRKRRGVEYLGADEDCRNDCLKLDPKLAVVDVWPKVVLSKILTGAILHISRLANGVGS